MKNKVVSFISYLFLAAQFVLSIVISLIEKNIPIHWNIYGDVDAYGSSYYIFVITSINFASFIFLRWLSLHPEVCNFPRPFKNKDIAYSIMSAMLKMVELYISALFLYITIGTFSRNLCIYIIYIFISCLIYTIVAGIVKLCKS